MVLGYGVIAPKTQWGRLVCIAYAIIGLPIMLICLASVGDVMANIFRFSYATVCCCGCCRRKPKKVVNLLPHQNHYFGNSVKHFPVFRYEIAKWAVAIEKVHKDMLSFNYKINPVTTNAFYFMQHYILGF